MLPAGTQRRLQPVVDKFFYSLTANNIETQRLGLWWANRMLATPRPLEEKLTLFWHGHFATGQNKVRDYRMMLQQNRMLRANASGNLRDLLVGILKDPGMLVYLDNGENIKSHPNENFGRELLELFSMGVGNYSERDVREAARAFTGWTNDVLTYKFDSAAARLRRQDVPRTHRSVQRRRHHRHDPRAAGDGRVRGRQAVSLLRAGGHLDRRQSGTRTFIPRERLSDQAAHDGGCCSRRTSTALRRSRLRSRARCISSSRPTGRWACVTCRRFRTSVA